MSEQRHRFQPIARPLLRAIRPPTSPFRFAPGIPDDNKPLAFDFDSAKDGVGVVTHETLDEGFVPVPARVEAIERAAEDTVLVCS